MQAKIKPSARYSNMTFFSGVPFSKNAWQDVPSGREQEARGNPFLEVDEPAEAEALPQPVIVEIAVLPEPVTPQEVIKNIRGNRKGGRK